MSLSEFNWDLNVAGTWPRPIKFLAILFVCSLVTGGWVYFNTMDQFAELEKLEQKEQELKISFEIKQNKAVNLEDYRNQLKQIEASLGEMIRQMPTRAEVANLLVDITQTGLASGLEFQLFKPAGEVRKEFYTELPINIQVIGKYEELALFVSGLASLPRIVTVHDVSIVPKDGAEMQMDATIKTYREGDLESENNEGKKKKWRRKNENEAA